MTKAQLEKTLKEFPDVEPDMVSVEGNGKLVAKLVVSSFDGVDEADRQERVYDGPRPALPLAPPTP